MTPTRLASCALLLAVVCLCAFSSASAAPHASARGADVDSLHSHSASAAEAFVDSLLSGLQAKAHLQRIKAKYERALEVEADAANGEEAEPVAPVTAAPKASRKPRAAAKPTAKRSKATRINRAHIPRRSVSTDPSLPVLAPVAASSARADASDDAPFVLHPINAAPSAPYSSGLNFTTFVYPTVQGNVTIFVGIVEYAVGKFHFFPAPRSTPAADDDDASVTPDAQRMYAAQQTNAKARAKAKGKTPASKAKGSFPAPLSSPSCDGVATTSVSANSYGCLLAQNAGFFNMITNGCLGNVVSNEVLINTAAPNLVAHSNFGLTQGGNFVTGYLTPAEVSAGIDGGFAELIQGSGWLVREGQSYINTSMVSESLDPHFCTEKAPRNAIGHDSAGRLLMFEADGEEDIDLGLSLFEFADILSTHFDVVNALNVDGGGSSTTVYKGVVADKPTCRDTPQQCERAVTTISCVMP